MGMKREPDTPLHYKPMSLSNYPRYYQIALPRDFSDVRRDHISDEGLAWAAGHENKQPNAAHADCFLRTLWLQVFGTLTLAFQH